MKPMFVFQGDKHQAQRGAAILTAMLTVALVATLASAMLWQQWRQTEVEAAQRARVQSQWVLTGALDWARLILREDARQGGSDNLTEPWAVPLAPARLSTFLSAQQGQVTVGDDDDPSQEAFLSGHIQDLQARLNLTNLIEGDKIHAPTLAIWKRLFKQLDLPEGQVDALAQNLLLAVAAGKPASKSNTPDQPNAPQAALLPRTVAEIVWLGLPDASVRALMPFITVLPMRTVVNINTAPLEVLVASVPQLTTAQARQLMQSRATRPLETLMDALLVISDAKVQFDPAEHGVASRFFEVTGTLRVGQNTVQEQSVLQRDGMVVKVLIRTRGALAPTSS